jgi:hypothetical protein
MFGHFGHFGHWFGTREIYTQLRERIPNSVPNVPNVPAKGAHI